MKTFKLHLIRHGLTSGNLQGLYIGSGTDIPLCDEGRAQLAELKERFEYPQVDTVFSSPLMRAVETANILFPNATHQFSVHDLREAGFGVFENHPVKELVKNEDFKKWITPAPACAGGRRAHGTVPRTLLGDAAQAVRVYDPDGRHRGCCVTHGGVIMSMLSQRALPSRHPEQWMADPGCGYTVQTDVQLWMRDRLVEAIDIVPSAMPIPCGVRRKLRRTKHSNKKERSAALRFCRRAAFLYSFGTKNQQRKRKTCGRTLSNP